MTTLTNPTRRRTKHFRPLFLVRNSFCLHVLVVFFASFAPSRFNFRLPLTRQSPVASRHSSLLFLLVLLLCSAASAQEPASLTARQPVQAQEQPLATYVLGPGDTITIRALNVEEISEKPVRIGTSGIIKFPLIGS